jgi:hypothetical protein
MIVDNKVNHPVEVELDWRMNANGRRLQSTTSELHEEAIFVSFGV